MLVLRKASVVPCSEGWAQPLLCWCPTSPGAVGLLSALGRGTTAAHAGFTVTSVVWERLLQLGQGANPSSKETKCLDNFLLLGFGWLGTLQ